jgi:hypothetical protein
MPFVKDWLAAKKGAIELLSLAPVPCTYHSTAIPIPGIRMAVEWLPQTLFPSLHLFPRYFCSASPGREYGGQM